MKVLHPYNLQAIHLILLAVFALCCVHVSLGAVSDYRILCAVDVSERHVVNAM